MEEIWKDIPKYEGYKISNLGKIKSYKKKNEKILKQFLSKNGYIRVVLININKERKYESLHRLMAQAFIPNPNNYPVVNHKNGIKTDNRPENLEWCTHSHNRKEAYRLGLCQRKATRRMNNLNRIHQNNKIKINQYDLDGNFIKTWDSASDVYKASGISFANICSCCRGKKKTAGGYIWKYEKGYKG